MGKERLVSENSRRVISRREFLEFLAITGANVLLYSCNDGTPTPTSTPARIPTLTPSRSPTSTETPKPTEIPTRTPSPTKTLIPTETPMPIVEIGELNQAGKIFLTFENGSSCYGCPQTLWVANPDGTERRLLKETKTKFSSVKRIGPDRVTVWESNDIYGLDWSILVFDSTGKELLKVPAGIAGYLTPDAKRLLFSGQQDGDGIYELNLETGEERKLIQSTSATRDTSPNISPDSKKLIFAHYESGNFFSLRMLDYPNIKTHWTNSVFLTEGISLVRNAGLIYKWSPDGKKLIYSSGIEEWDLDGEKLIRRVRGEIGIIDSEQLTVQKIYSKVVQPQDTSVFDISPDSQKIVYVDRGKENTGKAIDKCKRIYIFDLATGQEQIFPPPFGDECLVDAVIKSVKWVPNTDKISFIFDPLNKYLNGLYVLDSNTGNIEKLPETIRIYSYDWLEK